MDWNNRIKNPLFWIFIICTNGGIILSNAGLSPTDVTSWEILFNAITYTLKNPVSLMTCITTSIGIIFNPTTKGFKDYNINSKGGSYNYE